jgi:hypothetical protein
MEKDKEIAMSGIAARFSALRNGEVLISGLWKQDLLLELL